MSSIVGFLSQPPCSLTPLDDARSTVWELVVRSGNVNVLRTQLGCVGWNFLPVHRSTQVHRSLQRRLGGRLSCRRRSQSCAILHCTLNLSFVRGLVLPLFWWIAPPQQAFICLPPGKASARVTLRVPSTLWCASLLHAVFCCSGR